MSDENKSIQEENQPQTQAAQQVHNGGQGGSVVAHKADEKLIEFVSMYTHGLVNKMDALAGKMTALWISLVVLALVLVGASLYMYTCMQDMKAEFLRQSQNTERTLSETTRYLKEEAVKQSKEYATMDKRHWELSKVVDFSQERSAKKKAEKQDVETLP